MSLELGSYLLGKKSGGGGGSVNLQNKSVTVTTNGTQDITADTGYDGLKKVALTTNVEPDLQTKNITITENGTRTVINDIGYDGLEEVNITTNVSGGDLSEYFTDHYTELHYTGQYLWQSSLRKIPPITLPNYFISLSTAFYNMPFTIYAIEFDENFDTSNVTTFYGMFQNSKGLVELDLSVFNTSNVTNMSGMFNGCNLLRKINMSSFDMSKVNNITSMFQSLGSLEEISFGVNLGKGFTSSQSLNLTGSSLLTHDSLMSIINNLYDISASGITCYLALGSTNLAKLTSDEIGVATAKGWTVS